MGLVMFYAYNMLKKSSYLRTTHPYNIICLSVLVLSQALFVGGMCAHSFLSAIFLAGIFVSTVSQALAAAYTWRSNKSRRLKKNTHLFVLIGFGIYVGIFVLFWDFLDKTHSLTYREFFFWAWIVGYLPFSFYFPYALVLFVLPELEDSSDFILAAINLWMNFPELALRVATKWKE